MMREIMETNTTDTIFISEMEELRELVDGIEDGTVLSIRIREVMILAEEE